MTRYGALSWRASRELVRDLSRLRALDLREHHAAQGRRPRGRRADLGGPGWGRARVRAPVRAARRGRPASRAPAGVGAGRGRPGLRRLHVDRLRAGARLHPTDDLTPFDPGVPFRDTAIEGFENAAAARAFASLPERWQLVLWHTEVEGQKPAEVAPLLGLSPNSVSALAYRAREGLRQAFLSMHAQDTADATCLWAQEHLGAHVRGGLSRRDSSRVERHLVECRRCTAVYLELL